jgi:hypothetical protein
MADKPHLDLIFPDIHTSLLLGIGDASIYPVGFTPTSPTIEIKPPIVNKVTLPFTAGGFMTFNSNDLKITCDADPCDLADLPDGIWEVKYSIYPATSYSVTKKFIRVFNLLRRFEVAFMKVDMMEANKNVKTQDLEILTQIYFFIQGAIATANDCNYIKAMELYREADKMLSHFLKTKC